MTLLEIPLQSDVARNCSGSYESSQGLKETMKFSAIHINVLAFEGSNTLNVCSIEDCPCVKGKEVALVTSGVTCHKKKYPFRNHVTWDSGIPNSRFMSQVGAKSRLSAPLFFPSQ
eukprot:1892762-Amphidinium_carterae.2